MPWFACSALRSAFRIARSLVPDRAFPSSVPGRVPDRAFHDLRSEWAYKLILRLIIVFMNQLITDSLIAAATRSITVGPHVEGTQQNEKGLWNSLVFLVFLVL